MSLTLVRADGASITLDVTAGVSTARTVSLTEYAVEEGAAISDAAQVLPPRFTIDGVVAFEGPSASPGVVASAVGSAAAGAVLGGQVQSGVLPATLTGRARLVAAEAFLEACLGQPLTLIWRGRAWPNVFIEELTEAAAGTVYRPQITIKQVRQVSAQTVRLQRQVRRSKPSLQQEQPTGVQPTPAATPAQVAQTDISLLATAADTKVGGDALNRLNLGFLTKRAP